MADDSETSIKIYLREIMQTPLLTAQQEIELAARVKKGDQKARAWMIKANLRLVVKIAHDYSNLGLPLLDLISEGNLGLMKAVERFDPAKGGKLSTYGAWWIKQSIKRALANQRKTIRLPVHLIDKIYKLNRAALTMSDELGREPTDEELSEEIGISSAKLSQLKRVSIRPRPLMLRSAMMIQPNMARSSVMKMRRRRSSCSETRACAPNLASFWRCWTTASARLSSSDSGWTAANRKLSKKLERNSG